MPRSKKAKTSLRKSRVRRNKTPTKSSASNGDSVIARCMKCREQKPMQSAKLVTLKNGRNAMKGNCVCGTKMFKFV
jgi:hypothetical protein